MSDDLGVEFAVNRMRDLGRMLEGAMIDFPRVLKALERARNGTPEQLHEEAATFAARAKRAEDQVRYREADLRETRERLATVEGYLRAAQRDVLTIAKERDALRAELVRVAAGSRTTGVAWVES
jgi:hypothetical protein